MKQGLTFDSMRLKNRLTKSILQSDHSYKYFRFFEILIFYYLKNQIRSKTNANLSKLSLTYHRYLSTGMVRKSNEFQVIIQFCDRSILILYYPLLQSKDQTACIKRSKSCNTIK